MSWKTVRLEDICVSISDGDHQAPPKVNKGIPFITISNIDNLNKIDFSNVMYVPDNYYDGLDTKRKPQKNDILYSVVGTFGKPVYIDNDDKFVFQRHIAILRPNLEKIVPKFLYHITLSREFYAQADTLAIGAAQRTISLTALRKMKVDIPSLEMQNKITSILAKYDDLIANNNKRIKILEKMAENLYQEWFVRFRFPGYETAEFVDGVPKDWKKMNLFDVASVCYGYNFSSDLFCDDKSLYPVVRIRDIVNNYTNTFTSEECDEKYIIENNSILVGMDGIFHTRLWTGGRAFLNQRVVKLNSMIDKLSNYQLYHAVYPQIKFWEQTISGTTVAHLGDKHLKKMSIFMPDERTLKKAFDIFENLLEQQYILHKQNQNLIKQRNYLLPRLMSGNLQVK